MRWGNPGSLRAPMCCPHLRNPSISAGTALCPLQLCRLRLFSTYSSSSSSSTSPTFFLFCFSP
jgi:hypothetical protein